MNSPFKFNSKLELLIFSKQLLNNSLRKYISGSEFNFNYKNKGNFGQLIERYFFGYSPNSNPQADFYELGIELKTAPLKKLSKSKGFVSKERLVLSLIDYHKISNQTFLESDFFKKGIHLLLIFYLYEENKLLWDYIIKLVELWQIPDEDLLIIERDWLNIQAKVKAGKAHEISEGDTLYLGACTKGVSSKSLRPQPFNPTLAKQRAFSLKQGYVNHILASITRKNKQQFGRIFKKSEDVKSFGLEELVIKRLYPFIGLTISQIISKLNIILNPNAKGFYASLTKAMLGIGLEQEIEEFKKAEIVVKTVRLKPNKMPKEDISFPFFNYLDIVNQNWEDSDFNEILERKFLFIFLQINPHGLVFDKVCFWNMPLNDRREAQEIWEKTRNLIATGNIVKEIKLDSRRTNFPNKKTFKVGHVRPHAKNANDTLPLPVMDKISGLKEYTKHSFWLNNTYIRDEIYLKVE